MQRMSWYQALLGKWSCWFSGVAKARTPVSRSAAEQASVDKEANFLTLYELRSCHYSAKVRRHLKWLNVAVTSKDLKRCHIYQKELLAGGGRAQVPCLKIEKPGGNEEWLYESQDILDYLDRKFAPKSLIDTQSAPQQDRRAA